MANYTSKSEIIVSINGQQAEKMMETLKQDAKSLEVQIEKAAKAGDKVKASKLTRELNKTRRAMDQLKSTTKTVEQTLSHLDKASPRELSKTLSTLQRQLNGIERGTKAWDAQTAKIRAVKAELQKVNSTLKTQPGLWSKINSVLSKWQTTIMAGAAGMTGLIMAGRKAVEAYADMDQEMANVRKYTGMNQQLVAELNDELKKIDTRTPREQLNQLAGEAGRLGKTSKEDVLGFVRAADQINVALDELGEGATLTLSKLTGVFGDEAKYGTEQSLLKVGSVINELSQNCRAGAPYLAEFASRMGGVGAQAGMTISDIMGFAAVLDSNNQKVESSSTALSQVIVRLMTEPAKYAKVAGLEVKKFTDMLKTDVNGALIMLLEKLNSAGGMNILAKMFSDMGENGSRAISTLSTLATHIDEVKQQQEEANKAFIEGTSVTREFEVQNSTVQAEMEKACNRVHELAIELGEKLYPFMKHIYTSSTAFLKVLTQLVGFVFKYKTQIISLLAGLAAWKAAQTVINSLDNIHYGLLKAKEIVIKACTAAQTAWNAAISLFNGGLTQAIANTKAFIAANAATVWGAVAAAIGLAVTAITYLVTKTDEVDEATKRLRDTSAEMEAEYASEKMKIDELFGALKAAEEGTAAYEKAKQAIINQYGTYLQGLSNEIVKLYDVAGAYDAICEAAIRSARARALDKAMANADDKFVQQYGENSNALLNSLDSVTIVGSDGKKRKLTSLEKSTYHQRFSQELVNGGLTKESLGLLEKMGIYLGSDKQLRPSMNTRGLSTREIDQNFETAKILHKMSKTSNIYKGERQKAKNMFGDPDDKYRSVTDYGLQNVRSQLNAIVTDKSIKDQKITVRFKNGTVIEAANKEEAKSIIKEIDGFVQRRKQQSVLEDQTEEDSGTSLTNGLGGGGDYVTQKELKNRAKAAKAIQSAQSKAQKQQAAEQRRAEAAEAKRKRLAEAKAKKEFKDDLDEAKKQWEADSVTNNTEYTMGLKSWTDYLNKKHELQVKLYEDLEKVYEKHNLQEDEDYQELLKKKSEHAMKWLDEQAAMSVQNAQRMQSIEETNAQIDFYSTNSHLYQNEEALQDELFAIRIKYLKKMRSFYNELSEEYHNYTVQIEEEEQAHRLEMRRRMMEKYEEWVSQYTALSAERQYLMERKIVQKLYDEKKISEEQYQLWLAQLREKFRKEEADAQDAAEGSRYKINFNGEDLDIRSDDEQRSAERAKLDRARANAIDELNKRLQAGLITQEQYEAGIEQIEKAYRKGLLDPLREALDSQSQMLLDMGMAWFEFFRKMKDGGKITFDDIKDIAAATFATLTAGLQMYSQFMAQQQEIELAAVEKKYNREVELAQGNSYKVAKAEKTKEEEMNKIKAEYARKEFAVKVIEAIAQTAQNAIAAYGAALQIGPAGLVLAPIMAGLAAAQGAIQIALIKKQQEAAAAKGYSEGGFTPDGRVDEPVGVVHAGEWVASQKLVRNPQTRPLLEALDYAQRTNTIGSIRMADVSKSVTAPIVMAEQRQQPVVVSQPSPTVVVEQNSEYARTMKKLAQRLEQPLRSIVTVTGNDGIERAEMEYKRLMNNKTPKLK